MMFINMRDADVRIASSIVSQLPMPALENAGKDWRSPETFDDCRESRAGPSLTHIQHHTMGRAVMKIEQISGAMPGRHVIWYQILRAWLGKWLCRHRAPKGSRWYDADGSGL